MKNLLNKEFKLCLSPINYVFLLFASMLAIPNYPRYVSFFYICLCTFLVFNVAENNKDIEYSMVLPIQKKDIVKARCTLICIYEVLEYIIAIPFAIISIKSKMPNEAGIDTNLAFFGFSMIVLTIFHFTFMVNYYKKCEKAGKVFLFSSILYFISYIVFEAPIIIGTKMNIPFILFLDSTTPQNLIRQIPIFVGGLIIYIIGWILTYKISAKNFEKVNI